jgi:LmbE family N-acetylglucosaminyl deacetylase
MAAPACLVPVPEPTSTRHPDHVHAAKATALAVEITNIPAKLYFTAHGSKYWHRIRETLSQIGIERPAPAPQRLLVTDLVEQQITTIIDVRPFVERKRAALSAHASQLNNSIAAKVPAEQWSNVFGTDTFIRAYDATAAGTPEDPKTTSSPGYIGNQKEWWMACPKCHFSADTADHRMKPISV